VTQLRLDFGQIEVLDDEMAEVLRRKTEAERLQIANAMWESARKILLGVVRDEHPDWPEQQVQAAVARRLSHGAV
jgi:hypothetical protein